jgi:hypothetical protein
MHIAERRLELFALDPGRFSDNEKTEIENHLKECKWCDEAYEQMLETYANFDEVETSQSQTQVRGRLENHLPILQSNRPESVQVASSTKPQRFVGFVISQMSRHPFTSASGILLAGLLVAALLNWSRLFSSPNPAQAIAKDGFLRVYDDKGKELWARFIDQDYSMADTLSPEGASSVISVYDVAADGRNEVLTVMGWEASGRQPNAVICFKPDGSVLWQYELHRNVSFGSTSYTDDYRCHLMLTGDFDHDGRKDVLVAAMHRQWEPEVLFLLDAAEGSLKAEYWLFGHVSQVLSVDLNGDGIDEIVAFGDDVDQKLTCIVVLDPREIRGCVPLSPEHRPKDIPLGTEEYYILLPRSDLSAASADFLPGQGPMEVMANGTISAVNTEIIDSKACGLFFDFDKKMRCISVRPANNFLGLHRQLERQGILKDRVNSLYLKKLQEGVRYWDGEKFVNEAVMNKNYRAALKR